MVLLKTMSSVAQGLSQTYAGNFILNVAYMDAKHTRGTHRLSGEELEGARVGKALRYSYLAYIY